MAEVGFGFGKGLQGAPREYTSIYMQRKAAEAQAAQQEALARRKADEEDAEALKQFIMPNDIHYKLQPEMEKATLDAINQAAANQKNSPLTHRNQNTVLMQQLLNKKMELTKRSEPYKMLEKSIHSGKVRATQGMSDYVSTGRGDFIGGLDGTESIYGLKVNPKNGEISYNEVKAIDIPSYNQRKIFNQRGALKPKLDANGNMVTFNVDGVTHFVEELDIPFARAEFEALMQEDEDYRQNNLINYVEYQRDQGTFNINEAFDQFGEPTAKYKEEAKNFGWNAVLKAGEELQKATAVSRDRKIIINNNNNMPGGDAAYMKEFEITESPLSFNWKHPVTGDIVKKTATADQITFGSVKVQAQDNDETVSTSTNEPLEKGANRFNDYGQIAGLPYYKKGVKLEIADPNSPGGKKLVDVSGMLVHDEALLEPKINNAETIEYRVVGTGKADKGNGLFEDVATPVKNIKSRIYQAMSDDAKKRGTVFLATEQAKMDASINKLEAKMAEKNAALPRRNAAGQYVKPIAPVVAPPKAQPKAPPAGNKKGAAAPAKGTVVIPDF